METKNSNKKLRHSKQYLTYNISPSTAVQVAYLHASYSKTGNFEAITTAYGEDAVALVTTQLELHAQAIQKSKEEFLNGLTGPVTNKDLILDPTKPAYLVRVK